MSKNKSIDSLSLANLVKTLKQNHSFNTLFETQSDKQQSVKFKEKINYLCSISKFENYNPNNPYYDKKKIELLWNLATNEKVSNFLKK